MFKRMLLSMALVAIPLGAGFAGHLEGDHDRARAALKAGRAVPLQDILDTVANSFQGEMLEVELEDEDGRLLYEVKLLTPDGSILKLYYDARTKELLAAEGRGVKKTRRDRD